MSPTSDKIIYRQEWIDHVEGMTNDRIPKKNPSNAREKNDGQTKKHIDRYDTVTDNSLKN